MRKYFSILIMLAICLGTLVTPAFSAEEKATVIQHGQSSNRQFWGKQDAPVTFSGHKKEAQVENYGNLTIQYAVFNNNKLTSPNSKNKNFSTLYNITGTIDYIRGTIFSGNSTYTNGGAISNVTGVITEISGAVTEQDIRKYTSTTTFKENQSSIGGAIYNNKTSRIDNINGVLFQKNTATSNGGAIYSVGTMSYIKNSVFINNAAEGDGSQSAGFGGAIYAGKDLEIGNTNFINNSAKRNGGAIAMVGGNLTLTASGENERGVAKSVIFMDNLAGPMKNNVEGSNRNDLYFGGKNQTLNLFAEKAGNKIILDGGISIANNLTININKPVKIAGSSGSGSVYINGDVGSDSARANLYIYGGDLSLSNAGTVAYESTDDFFINTIWANKVALYSNTELSFDIYLFNGGGVDESVADQLKLNSLSGQGCFVLREDSFNVVDDFVTEDFTANLKLIDTKVNINNRVIMYDAKDNSTKILYKYDEKDDITPIYKIRLTTDGTVIFSNPYYIDEVTNSLAYAVNYPAVNEPEKPCSGLGERYELRLKKNITINSWEDLPDEQKTLHPRNRVLVDALFIYGNNKTITAEENLVGFVVGKNCQGDSKYLYAEKTTFQDFENAISNEGGKIDLNNVSFNRNGRVDASKNITTLRGGALTNLSGEMNIAGTKKNPKSNFYNNKAKEGGAVYNSDVMTIDYSTFGGVTKNAGKKSEKTFLNSAIYGGAIYNYQNANSKLTVNNTKFIANTAVDGGAIYNSYDKGTTLLDNYIIYEGMVYDIGGKDVEKVDQYFDGAVLLDGQIVYDGYIYNGAVEIEKYVAPITIADATEINKATFTYNKADRMGGAIYNDGNLVVVGSNFGKTKKNANVAGEAGAAVANVGEGVFTSRLSNYYYSTGNNGGAIFNTDNAITHLEGGTFSRNVAKYCGGVIFNDKDATLTLTEYTNPVNNKIVYLAMSNNSAIYGGAIYNKGTINLVNGLKNLSGTYNSNKATYSVQNIVYLENGRSDAYNLARVAELVTGNYDFVAKNELPKAYLNNGKYIYYDYVAPKGGAIYNDGIVLKENNIVVDGKVYDLDVIHKIDEYIPAGSMDTDNVVHPLVSTDLVRDNLVYDMSNAVMGDKYIEATQLTDGQITQFITNDPNKIQGWLKTEDTILQYNDPNSQVGGWFVFDGAEYVKDYVIGTPLLPGMVVYEGDRYTGAKYLADYVKGTPYDPEKQMVYNEYIYDYKIMGDFQEETVLVGDQIRWKTSPRGDAVYTGLVNKGEYIDGLNDDEIVRNDDHVWTGYKCLGDYVPPLEDGQFVHNGIVYSGKAIDMGAYTIGTQLKTGQYVHNGIVYSGVEEIGAYRPGTVLEPGYIIDNDRVWYGLNKVETYREGTPLRNGQIVYQGYIYNNAQYVAKYREGTPLSQGQIVLSDGYIYDGAKLLRDNVEPSTVDKTALAAEDKYLYGRAIYDISEVEKTDTKYIPPIVPVEGSQQIVYNGIIYDLNGSFNTGIEYVAPSQFNSATQIIINGVIYNKTDDTRSVVYDPGTKLGYKQYVIDGIVYDFSKAKELGVYVKPNLGNGPDEVVYNGRVYNIKDITVIGPYEPSTKLGPNQEVIDGKVYDFTGATDLGEYKPETDISGNPNLVVIDGIIYDITNAKYVDKYYEGTILGDNEYRIGDIVYELTNKGVKYIEPVLPDAEKGEVVIDGKIYSLADATNRGEYIEPTELGEDEVLYDGKVYNIKNATKGIKYEFGTELADDEIVYNGYVYSNAEIRGLYVPGTELQDGEIVYNGYIYANATPVGDYINAELQINQASFKSNTANVKVVLKDNNSYMDESQLGLRYTQQITYFVGKGGAIYNASNLPINIWSSKFTSNKAARYGGAICNENKDSDLNLENVEFKSNTAKSVVTTVKTYIVTQGAKITKRKQTIKENVGFGGAIYTEGNVYINTNPLFDAKVRTTTFTSNSSAFGGAIYALGEVVIGADTKFTSNSALFDGGAVYSMSNKPFEYSEYTELTKFDYTQILGQDYNYTYKHCADMDFDIKVLGTQDYVDSVTGELVKGMPVVFNKNSAKGNGGAIIGNKIYVEGATFTNNKATYVKNNVDTGNGGAIYAMGDIVVNPFANTIDDNGSVPRTEFRSNTARNGGAIYANSTSLIKNADFISNKATANNAVGGDSGSLYVGGYGGAVYTKGDSLIVNSTFSKNSAAYGGALYVGQYATSYVVNSSFTGNKASKAGGAIYLDNYSKMYIMAYAMREQDVNVSITGNKVGNKTNSIYMSEGSSIYIYALNYGDGKASVTIDHIDGGDNDNTFVYVRGDGIVTVKKSVNVSWTDADSSNPNGEKHTGSDEIKGVLDLVAENLVKACSFYLSGSEIRIDNNRIGTLELKTLSLADGTTSYTAIDVDMQKKVSDKVQAKVVEGNGTLSASSVNLINNSRSPVMIEVGKDSVINSISTKKAESAEATYKLKSYYDENGLLRVVAYGQKAKPSAVAAPVAAQIGGYLTQINSYDQAFMNMDLNMIRPRTEREADCDSSLRGANGDVAIQKNNCDNDISYNAKGLWNRPYATFERVNLNNGPKVSNIGYGNFFGGDADMKELNNGWKRQFSAYIGYNGSVQDYDRQSIDQNGGTVGVTEVWYKKNFFTGLTLNAGANVAQASTDLGRENMPMFMTGVASKTGYNFEFKEGKFIVQPSLLLSYSFIHTFAHDNGRGSHVGSSPLNAIQVAPGIKFIANLKNGWQPYLGVNMRWNIIDKTHFSLTDVNIPDMSIDPYVEYGVGLQRRWGERFTGFGQAMIRNGGRNGVMLSFGFKWLIGK